MRGHAIITLSIGLLLSSPAIAQETHIVGPVADGTPSAPAPLQAVPEFTIETTCEHRLADRKVIMHRVANPGLPEPPPPTEPATKTELEAVQSALEFQKLIDDYKPLQLIFLSATVFDHKATFLRWWHGGREFQAWSNVDFNHIGGFAEFESEEQRYALFMGLGNETRDPANQFHWPQEPPDLGVADPAYALIKGDASNDEAMAIMDALHDLYATDKERLIAAYEGRERARAEREAFLKVNPPQPRDTVIHFWPRKGSRYLEDNPAQKEDSK